MSESPTVTIGNKAIDPNVETKKSRILSFKDYLKKRKKDGSKD